MEALVALIIGVLTGCGVYLVLRARTFPVVLGLTLLSYAVNVFLLITGRLVIGQPPVIRNGASYADPLTQALVLTAIVIGFAMTTFVIVLALRARRTGQRPRGWARMMYAHLPILPILFPFAVAVLLLALRDLPMPVRRVLAGLAILAQIGIAVALVAATAGGEIPVYRLGDWPAACCCSPSSPSRPPSCLCSSGCRRPTRTPRRRWPRCSPS